MAENDDKVARGVLYAVTRVILVVVAVLVIALGFYAGMDSMNVNVIAKDAFTMRAEDVLTPKTGYEADLPKLFTREFIENDPVLNSQAYADYNVSNFYQRTDVKAQIIWPWSDRAVVHATEEIFDITGTLKENAEAASTAGGTGDDTQVTVKDKNPPEWVDGEYEVTLIKDPVTSSWKVQEMKLIREIQSETTVPGGEGETASLSGESTAAQEKTVGG